MTEEGDARDLESKSTLEHITYPSSSYFSFSSVSQSSQSILYYISFFRAASVSHFSGQPSRINFRESQPPYFDAEPDKKARNERRKIYFSNLNNGILHFLGAVKIFNMFFPSTFFVLRLAVPVPHIPGRFLDVYTLLCTVIVRSVQRN